MDLLTVVVFFLCDLYYGMCLTCKITVDKNDKGEIKVADCSKRGLGAVPHDLPYDINVLDMSKNNFHTIENDTFSNFSVLEELRLSKNKLHQLSSGAFHGLHALKILDMSNNLLDLAFVYTKELFTPIKNLTELRIRRNMPQPDLTKSNNFTYPDQAIGLLSELSFLSMDLLPFPQFGLRFRKLTKLQHLDFQFCYLRNLVNSTFDNFSASVKILEMRQCYLHFVHTEINALSPFPDLQVVDFSDSLMHLTQALKLLYPYGNKSMKFNKINFHHVSSDTFSSEQYPFSLILKTDMMLYLKTICVENLDLSQNGIVDYEPDSLFSFDYPECIQSLNLNRNRFVLGYGDQLQYLQSFFNKAVNIKVIDYSYTAISFEHETPQMVSPKMNSRSNIVIFPSSLEQLHMDHVICNDFPVLYLFTDGSNLTYLDLSYSSTTSNIFFSSKTAVKLETFIFSGGDFRFAWLQLSRYKTQTFKTLTWRDANLNEAMNDKFVDLFKNMNSIENLDLSMNDLWYLRDNLLLHMINLSNLNLSKNLFQTVPPQLTYHLNLRALDLSNNLLTSVAKEIRQWADKMQTRHGFKLYLEGNSFQCICENIEFIRWLQTTKVSLDSDSYRCVLSNGTVLSTTEAFNSLHILFSDCNSSVWLMFAVSLFIIALLLFAYYKRWAILWFLYKFFRWAVERKLRKKHKYDVYISYEGHIITWIKNIIVPKLEGWGLTMCIKDRDFLPGRIYADAVIEGIHESRHIIFIIDASFKSSDECIFEIQRTKYELLIQNFESVIVIAKDINITDIPVELSHIWNNISFIQWPTNENELDLSWKKLKMWLFLQPNLQ